MSRKNALQAAIKKNETQRQSASGVFSQATGKIYDLNIAELKPNPHQPRLEIREEELAELAESIEKNDLIHPILVAKDDNGYTIIAGHRRVAACRKLGRESIKAVVKKEVDERDFAAVALAENLQRKALHPIEVGMTLHTLLEHGLFDNQSELARAIGKNKATISKYLGLLKLPEPVRAAAKERQLSDLEILAGLNRLPSPRIHEAFDHIVAEKLGRREALEYLKGVKEVEIHPYRYRKREGRISMALDLNRFGGKKRKALEEALTRVMEILEG